MLKRSTHSLSAPLLLRLCLPLCAAACLFGCKSTPQRPDAGLELARYEFATTQDTGFEAWASGDESAAMMSAQSGDWSTETLFMQAEISYWAGDVELAFERHAELILTQPGSPLTRLSAARINDLSDDVMDYEPRVRALLGQVSFGQVHPLAASYLAMAGQQATLNAWLAERPERPFDADALGLPLQWRHTPVLSRFRLSDFDTPFAPETQAQLTETYLSPHIAEDVPLNQKPTYPYVSSNISLSPDMDQPGIYYMETFATVTADTAQVYWLYTNFSSAARLWVDGVEVIERRESNYEPGKQWRRVKLAPGTHRVLLKLAHQPGYRDWFDMSFLNKNATLAGGSQIAFSMDAPSGAIAKSEGITLLSETMDQAHIDPFIVHNTQIKDASDAELYLGVLAAHYDRRGEFFDGPYEALVARRPEFAAAYGLKSLQARTLWEVPSSRRDDIALKALRRAQTLDPQSVLYARRLGNWLKRKGESPEVEALLRQAAQGAIERPDEQGEARVRNVGALNTWASYLEGEGWNELAEKAYRDVLAVSPTNCGAASSLQSLMYARELYLEPKAISEQAATRCPSLHETWLGLQPELYEEKLALEKSAAIRYPYSSRGQISYVRALESRGESEQAQAVLKSALERMPWSRTLIEELVDRAHTTSGPDAGLAVLDAYQDVYTNYGWMVWKRGELTGKLPLTDLMMNAREVAMELAKKEPVSPVGSVEQTGGNSAGDEAFYVIDFAAKKYFDDGTSVQLTHTLVRVMTKNAIDRFGELSVPGGSRLIQARTIKQDGTIQTPVNVSGKETLSMPGLAEGDFVELAYLDYDSSYPTSRTHREGTRFFFKMQDISSLNSEYVIINPQGDVLRFHDAPKPEEFTYEALPAVRFVRTNSPRPRSEPRQLSADEFLPWVQLVREGATVGKPEQVRLYAREQIMDSMRISDGARETLQTWVKATRQEGRDEHVRQLYYAVTDYFTDTSTGFSTELSHTILEREGNPLLALKATYDMIGVQSEFFIMGSKYVGPLTHPMFAMQQYGDISLRVKMPDSGEYAWLTNVAKDAMFGSVMPYHAGQPAVCLSCEKEVKDTVPGQNVPLRRRNQRITATLQPDGKLVGQVVHVYDGDFAQSLRELFRQRQEPRQRDAIMENLTVAYLPGATVTSYEIQNLEARDEPLTLMMNFEREQFARKDGNGALLIEAKLFSPDIASSYATLPARTTPMLVARPSQAIDVLEITLPEGMKPALRSPEGVRKFESSFGTYERGTILEGGKLTLSSDIDLDIQRISAKDYPAFQAWAQDTEQSSVILLTLTK